jgi:Protein of unknown function (DUF4238)
MIVYPHGISTLMSGRKQHYIPQCLLRGFEASRSGKGPQVVVLRRGRDQYISSIEDVAAQRNFYSELSDDGRKTLDDLISEYENRLGLMLAELRASESGAAVNPLLAAETVTHLTVRSAFLRGVFSFGLEELISNVGALFADSENLRQHLGIDTAEPNAALNEEIDIALNQLASPLQSPEVRSMLKRVALFGLRESFAHDYDKHAGTLASLLRSANYALPRIARVGHNEALTKSVAPDSRVGALAALRWTVIHIRPDSHLLLSDCVALSGVNGGSAYVPYLLHPDDELETILLPLSSNQLLVGSRTDSVPEVHVADVNIAAVKCAFDFVVSSKRYVTREVVDLLGESSRATILSIVRESLGGTFVSGNRSPEPEVPRAPAIDAVVSHSYVVRFLDCADQTAAERITGVVRVIVNAMGHHVPVSRIDSITFASDYEHALSNLDRGFDTSTPLAPTSIEYGIGVAMAPMVLRDGKIRCSIIMRSWLGDALLRVEDAASHRFAVYTLASMVARAAYMDMVDTALPGLLLRPAEDTWDAFFFRHVDSVSSAYFAARTTADIEPDVGKGYLDLFRNALSLAGKTIPSARLDYRMHGDLDAFLRTALPLIRDVLTHAATVIGHFDALGLLILDDEDTKGLVLENELAGWVDVYQRDLEVIYDRRGQWKSARELLSLTVHVERLLWRFGVFPWKTQENQIRIEIPLASDMTALLGHTQPGTT